MKIAINCSFFQPKSGGIKEYIQNLVENLNEIDSENEYIIYVLQDYLEYAKQELKTSFRIKIIPFGGKSNSDKIKRSLLEGHFWRKEEKQEKWDIFHSPFFHAPKLKKTKLVLTVHDMRFFRYPETYTFLRYQFLKHAVKSSIKRADKIISISQFTKDEIIAAYNIDKNKITVIHEAINTNHFQNSELSSEDLGKVKELAGHPIILSVGHLEPRKNYNRLIKAFQSVKERLNPETKLVIIGKMGHDYKETLDLINNDKDVIYLNFVSQNLLNWIYKHASIFVFPTFYEGFGFPPLEAGVYDVPSAVSNLSSIPEICGDAVLYFNPYNIEDIAESMVNLLTNDSLNQMIRKKMQERIKCFSWIENAKETISVYQSM